MKPQPSESSASPVRRSPLRHLRRLGGFLLLAVPLYGILWFCSPVYHVFINKSVTACHNNMLNVAWAVSMAAGHKKGGLPAYTVDAEGNPLHSWRTLILPYIEETSLYKKIRLDEPWDSEYNQQFHDIILRFYHCRSDHENRDNPTTNYFLVTGPGSLFDGSKPTHGEDFPSRDSASETPLLIESSQSVHWMCPEDVSAADYAADRVSPVSPYHRNIVYTDLRPEILFQPPWWSYFSYTELFFGHILPVALLCLISLVTVLQFVRFFWELPIFGNHFESDQQPEEPSPGSGDGNA